MFLFLLDTRAVRLKIAESQHVKFEMKVHPKKASTCTLKYMKTVVRLSL